MKANTATQHCGYTEKESYSIYIEKEPLMVLTSTRDVMMTLGTILQKIIIDCFPPWWLPGPPGRRL